MVIKRIRAHIKRVWSERDPEAGTSWGIFGVALAITVGGLVLVTGVGLFLPALFVMWSAGFLHQIWDQVPALGYLQSVGFLIGFWVVGWTFGMLLRFLVFALFGGAK